MTRSFSEAPCEEGAVNTGWDVGRAFMADAQRIATLAMTQGGKYLDDLWLL